MLNTDTSSVMSQQNQAMQVEIKALKAAPVAAAAATTPSGANRTCNNNNRKKSDNDMEASSTQPFSQQSV